MFATRRQRARKWRAPALATCVLVAMALTSGSAVAGSAGTGVTTDPQPLKGTKRVSVRSDQQEGNRDSWGADIAGNNDRYVVFASKATNLVWNDNNGDPDVFIHDRQAGTTSRMSVQSGGLESNGKSEHAAISSDGRYVGFTSDARDLSGDGRDFDDVFVHDHVAGVTQKISVSRTGGEANGASDGASLSSSSTRVAFISEASDLVAVDDNGVADVFVRDVSTGETQLASVAPDGGQLAYGSTSTDISDDGRYVVFTVGWGGIYVHDTATGETTQFNPDMPWFNAAGSISADGRFVSLTTSMSFDPSDGNSDWDAYLWDTQTGSVELVSVDAAGQGAGNGSSFSSAVSGDGRHVAFTSEADNLIPQGQDTNGDEDVFVRDRVTQKTKRVSVDTFGVQANRESGGAAIDADGGVVAFDSEATNLVKWDRNGKKDVFARG